MYSLDKEVFEFLINSKILYLKVYVKLLWYIVNLSVLFFVISDMVMYIKCKYF